MYRNHKTFNINRQDIIMNTNYCFVILMFVLELIWDLKVHPLQDQEVPHYCVN